MGHLNPLAARVFILLVVFSASHSVYVADPHSTNVSSQRTPLSGITSGRSTRDATETSKNPTLPKRLDTSTNSRGRSTDSGAHDLDTNPIKTASNQHSKEAQEQTKGKSEAPSRGTLRSTDSKSSDQGFGSSPDGSKDDNNRDSKDDGTRRKKSRDNQVNEDTSESNRNNEAPSKARSIDNSSDSKGETQSDSDENRSRKNSGKAAVKDSSESVDSRSHDMVRTGKGDRRTVMENVNNEAEQDDHSVKKTSEKGRSHSEDSEEPARPAKKSEDQRNLRSDEPRDTSSEAISSAKKTAEKGRHNFDDLQDESERSEHSRENSEIQRQSHSDEEKHQLDESEHSRKGVKEERHNFEDSDRKPDEPVRSTKSAKDQRNARSGEARGKSDESDFSAKKTNRQGRSHSEDAEDRSEKPPRSAKKGESQRTSRTEEAKDKFNQFEHSTKNPGLKGKSHSDGSEREPKDTRLFGKKNDDPKRPHSGESKTNVNELRHPAKKTSGKERFQSGDESERSLGSEKGNRDHRNSHSDEPVNSAKKTGKSKEPNFKDTGNERLHRESSPQGIRGEPGMKKTNSKKPFDNSQHNRNAKEAKRGVPTSRFDGKSNGIKTPEIKDLSAKKTSEPKETRGRERPLRPAQGSVKKPESGKISRPIRNFEDRPSMKVEQGKSSKKTMEREPVAKKTSKKETKGSRVPQRENPERKSPASIAKGIEAGKGRKNNLDIADTKRPSRENSASKSEQRSKGNSDRDFIRDRPKDSRRIGTESAKKDEDKNIQSIPRQGEQPRRGTKEDQRDSHHVKVPDFVILPAKEPKQPSTSDVNTPKSPEATQKGPDRHFDFVPIQGVPKEQAKESTDNRNVKSSPPSPPLSTPKSSERGEANKENSSRPSFPSTPEVAFKNSEREQHDSEQKESPPLKQPSRNNANTNSSKFIDFSDHRDQDTSSRKDDSPRNRGGENSGNQPNPKENGFEESPVVGGIAPVAVKPVSQHPEPPRKNEGPRRNGRKNRDDDDDDKFESITVDTGVHGIDDWLPTNVVIPKHSRKHRKTGPTLEYAGEPESEDEDEDESEEEEEQHAPKAILSPKPVDIPENTIVADIKLKVPYCVFVEESLLTAQLFSLMPEELAQALEVPRSRICVAEIHEGDDEGSSTVTVVLRPDKGKRDPPLDKINMLNEMLQNPESALYTRADSVFTRLLDRNSTAITSESMLASKGESDPVKGGNNVAMACLAITLSAVLYAVLIGGFAYHWHNTRKQRDVANS